MIECGNIILGADISGLGVGYSLAQHENDPIILEKDGIYGGLGGNFTVEGFRFVHKDEKVNQIFVKSSRSYRIYRGKHLVECLKDKHKLYILVRPNSDYSIIICVKHTFAFTNNILPDWNPSVQLE